MNFDENIKNERFFAKELKINNITVYPYYEIRVLNITKITNVKIETIALIIKYYKDSKEKYHIKFLKEESKKYKKEIMNKLNLKQL